MNISGIRPKQEFYAGVERREPEKKEMHRLNQVAIRMVEMPPLFSEEPMNGPAAAVKVMADTFRDYDREVVAVVNLRADKAITKFLRGISLCASSVRQTGSKCGRYRSD